jgi:excisionase family DNA binding protein
VFYGAAQWAIEANTQFNLLLDEAARLTGLSRDLLYDEMRRGNLPYVKVGRRRLITRQHLQQFLGVAS